MVDLVISRGPEKAMTTVPDVEGVTHAQANTALRNMKLLMDFTQAYSDTVAEGRVISQSPSADSEVEEDTVVSLVISLGPESTTVTVPNVVEKLQSDAITILRDAGLGATSSQAYSDTVTKGLVISQSPAAGNEATKNSSVSLVISLGPEDSQVEFKSLLIKVPYSDIPTDSFTILIAYELDGKRVEGNPVTSTKEADKTEYEGLTSVPVGATWFLYLNNNTTPLQQGTVQ